MAVWECPDIRGDRCNCHPQCKHFHDFCAQQVLSLVFENIKQWLHLTVSLGSENSDRYLGLICYKQKRKHLDINFLLAVQSTCHSCKNIQHAKQCLCVPDKKRQTRYQCKSIFFPLSPLQTIGLCLYRASTDRCSWFEKEELNECEKTWILLLKDIGQDSHCTNWDTVPSFPEFLEKVACCILVFALCVLLPIATAWLMGNNLKQLLEMWVSALYVQWPSMVWKGI